MTLLPQIHFLAHIALLHNFIFGQEEQDLKSTDDVAYFYICDILQVLVLVDHIVMNEGEGLMFE